jgi:hypothetical protein
LQSGICPFAEPLGRFDRVDKGRGVEQQAHLSAPFDEVFYFFVGHRLPPVWVEDLDFAPLRSQHTLLSTGLLRAHYIHHRHAAAADGHRLSILDRFDQFRQLVLGIGYTDLHCLIIAI